jgi:UDP:flavonoid glycosyltransferase YjiC (YdhE family)
MLNQSLDFPANLVVCERVPQLSLLRNTHVFITHGGLGSVKEAIMAGVPMLVLPESHDQPYNAMRIRYHGLGEAIFPEKQTVDSIETAMLSALSGRYDRNIHTMQECFIAIESARPSRSIIEAYLT